MSVIYYPQSTTVNQRVVSGSAYTEVVLGVYPNIIFFFDTTSMIESASLGILPYTAAWTDSSSYANTSSYATNAANSAIVSGTFYNITASNAVFSSTSSISSTASYLYVPSGSGAWRIAISSSGDLVFSFF